MLPYAGLVVATDMRPRRLRCSDPLDGRHTLRTIDDARGLRDFCDTDAGSMLRVKGSDTLCPLGPGLVTDWDFRAKRLRTYVNGEVSRTARPAR